MTYIKNMWKWINENIIITIVIILLSFVVGGNIAKDKLEINPLIKESIVVLEVKKEVVLIPKKLEAKKNVECTPQEAKLILSDSAILKQMNLFVVDLNTARYVSHDITTSYHTKKQIFGVKRELIADSQLYMMLYEPVDDLNYNKKEYDRYISNQSKDFIKVDADIVKDKPKI